MLARLMQKMRSKKDTGDEAERIAERYLQKQGLHCIDRNYRCRFGEIDLIFHEAHGQNSVDKTLVFVEVRLRKNDHFEILVFLNLSAAPAGFTIKDLLINNVYNNVFDGSENHLNTGSFIKMKPWDYLVFELNT